MFQKIIFPVLVSLAFISCNCQKKAESGTTDHKTVAMPKTSDKIVNSTYPIEKAENGTIRLVEGQNIFLKDQQMNVTFTKTLNDSRCPMNARCITAGNSTVELELMTTTSRPQKFKLSVGDLRNGFVKSVEFGGYKISLENLYPSNSTEVGFEKLKGKYVIDLKIEKATK